MKKINDIIPYKGIASFAGYYSKSCDIVYSQVIRESEYV